jgi:hypothetical protein
MGAIEGKQEAKGWKVTGVVLGVEKTRDGVGCEGFCNRLFDSGQKAYGMRRAKHYFSNNRLISPRALVIFVSGSWITREH